MGRRCARIAFDFLHFRESVQPRVIVRVLYDKKFFYFSSLPSIFTYAPLIDSVVEFSLVCITLCLTRISLWLNPSPGSTLQEFSCNVNKSLGPSLARKQTTSTVPLTGSQHGRTIES